MACLSFPIRMRTSWGRSRSMSIPCASQRVNCGDPQPQSTMRSMPISGRTTLKKPETFAEPWQAQAFALAVKLSEEGHFTWKEWTTALADELRAAAERGEADDGSHYYDHWLT